MRNSFHWLIVLLACIAGSGCIRVILKPDALMSDHDQTNSFTAQRPFDDMHAVVAKNATHCWSNVSGGMLMPTGSGYVHAGGGIKREVEEKVVEPGKRAAVNVVVRAYWPLPPESYILRAEIESLNPTSTG